MLGAVQTKPMQTPVANETLSTYSVRFLG